MNGAFIDTPWLWTSLALMAAFSLAVGLMWWRLRQRADRLESALVDRQVLAAKHIQDDVPGLMPRAAFDSALDAAAARCDHERSSLCVLLVQLDGFDSVYETQGQRAADALLSAVAARLTEATPPQRAAARVGNGQIALVVDGGVEAGIGLARPLGIAMARPYALPGRAPLDLTVSIGIAAYPAHGARAMIVAYAGAAARAAMEAGGGTHAVFDPQAAQDMQDRALLLADLRAAITRSQLELFYQPKIDACSLQITAAEALVRWHHPTRGLVSPAVFIPLAERHGLIGAIGDWVIQEACRQAGLWRQAGLRMRVAINLSAFQMRQDDLVDRLEAALRKNQLQPGRFTVEITESLAMENTRATQQSFERMRQAGLHVAIDDFGAGQTSLAYLRTLPASELKLDISLVRDLASSPEARTIAEALIKLAHALKRRVVAEGVETTAQRDLLVLMGCDELQGFLFARPMSARAFGLWALDERPQGKSQFRASLFAETDTHAPG